MSYDPYDGTAVGDNLIKIKGELIYVEPEESVQGTAAQGCVCSGISDGRGKEPGRGREVG